MNKTTDEHNTIVNASGFLYQIRIVHEILQAFNNNKIKILATEHKWVDPITNNDGYIDLVLSIGNNGEMIVECKRTIDASWYFLVPDYDEGNYEDTFSSILWTLKYGDEHYAAWDELKLNPSSETSSFCSIRGAGEKDQPMLERLSSIVLRSIESVANEELYYPRTNGRVHFYIPVIVTNAKLFICRYKPSNISLSSGKIDDAQYLEVPFIRFTKSMSTRSKSSKLPTNISEANHENQRTVFIINSDHLIEVLQKNWDFVKINRQFDEYMPWEKVLMDKKG